MSSIEDLPPEVFQLILQHVATGDPAEDRRLFFPLIHVNRQFHQASLPLLYKRFSTQNLVDRGGAGFYDCSAQQVGLWARTILEDDYKASCVESVRIGVDYLFDICPYGKSESEYVNPLSDLSAVGAEHLRTMIADAFEDNKTQQEEWSTRCLERFESASILAATIARLTKLQHLHLHQGDEIWPELEIIVDSLRSHADADDTKQPLEALRSVIYGWGVGEKYPSQSRPLAAVARWPNLHMIAADHVSDEDTSLGAEGLPDFMNLQPGSTDLKDLMLKPGCKLLPEHLCRLASTARALEKFEYYIGDTFSVVPCSTPAISRALSPHKGSLRKVTLYYMDFETEVGEDYDHRWESMDFGDFVKLQHLEISFGMFFGFHTEGSGRRPGGPSSSQAKRHVLKALPASLESFSLAQCKQVDDVEPAMAALEAILSHKDDKFPVLRDLNITAYNGDAGTQATEMFDARDWAKVENPKVTLSLCDNNWGLEQCSYGDS